MLTDDELRAIVPCRECGGCGRIGESVWERRCFTCRGTGIDPERRERLEALIRQRELAFAFVAWADGYGAGHTDRGNGRDPNERPNPFEKGGRDDS